MKTPEPESSRGMLASPDAAMKRDPHGDSPALVLPSPEPPPDNLIPQPLIADQKGNMDIPSKIMNRLETDDLDSYVHYKDLVERHQCRLPDIAVPEQTTEDANGQLKIAVRCQVCQKVCSCWNKLQYHLQTHVNLRPYKCNVCEKKFYAASKLHRHKQTHSGNKPHKCPLCDVRVSRQEHLKRHMLVHFEEKPYKCSACNHGARRVDSIRQHIKSKHPGENVEWVFMGGDSTMRKEFVAKFLEENLKKAADEAQKSGGGGSLTSPGELMDGNENIAANHKQFEETKNIVVLPKKKSKRKRKGSHPKQIKDDDPQAKPNQSGISPPVKHENSEQGSCAANMGHPSAMITKSEPQSKATGACAGQISGREVKDEYRVPYSGNHGQSWPQGGLPHSNVSPGGHPMSQSQRQSALPFQMSQSQHYMTHHETAAAALRYSQPGSGGLHQNYLPQNANWNGQYPPLPQMSPTNMYGHGQAGLPVVMSNSIGSMVMPVQGMGSPHDHQMRSIPDFYRKRITGECEQLQKASRQQNN